MVGLNRKTKAGDENRKKYLKPPTAKQVLSHVRRLKVTDAQYERFFGIPRSTIYFVKAGERDLPARFWHIIYENIRPVSGAGFLEKAHIDNESEVSTKPTTSIPAKKKQNHSRLSQLQKL